MRQNARLTPILIGLSLVTTVVRCIAPPLFPPGTVMQIVGALSWPVEIPDRKMFMNVGFQFNYMLGTAVTIYTKPTFFPYDDGRALHNTDNNTTIHHPSVVASHRQPRDIAAAAPNADKYLLPYREHVAACNSHEEDTTADAAQKNLHDGDVNAGSMQDMSAGELYRSFEDALHDSGFHRSCLAKSVCQMARHPMHNHRGAGAAEAGKKKDDEDLLSELLHFILMPSVHQSFQQHEAELRSRFEAAETIGETGGDCDRAFVECLESPLDLFTQLTGHHDEFEEA